MSQPKKINEALIGQPDEAVKVSVGQEVWLASGSPPLRIKEFNDNDATALVTWHNGDREREERFPCEALRAFSTRLERN